METIRDFEDILGLHQVRYLVIGGLAFVFHARPRYTTVGTTNRSSLTSPALPPFTRSGWRQDSDVDCPARREAV